MTSGSRILVTGAGGFVGAAVAKAALAAGHEVVAVVRNDKARLASVANRLSLHRVDLSDGSAVEGQDGEAAPDKVIN